MKLTAILSFFPLAAFAANTVVKDVSLVDIASGEVRPHVNVVIDGAAIHAIVAAAAPIPATAIVIDGRGKFLMAGLWDMHVNTGAQPERLQAMLAGGVVGVRDVGGAWERVAEWRDKLANGAIGPWVIGSGPAIGSATPAGARSAFDRLWDLDVDFIAILPGISRDAYVALAEQARHWRLRFAGPVPASITPWEAIEVRQSSIESIASVATIDDRNAPAFLARCAMLGTRLVPMLAQWRRASAPEAERLARTYRLIDTAKRAGVEFLAASGAGDPGADVSLLDELEQLVAAGFTPREALDSATLAPARMGAWQDRAGSVAPGQDADLVLLDANPLDDIRNARQVSGVVLRGRYHAVKEPRL